MNEYEVVLAPGAEGDITAAFLWYQERNAGVADGFRTEVFGVIEAIAAAPLARPADGDGNRHRVLHRFPYSVFYELLGNVVTILAIAHHRRKPNHWRLRRF